MENLSNAAARYQRNVEDITIMAVSKTRSQEEVVEAREAGLTLFGENRSEEASEKFADLEAQTYPLYLIGHLQSNKISRITSRYAGVHSVDSVKLARKLSERRGEEDTPLEILLQVNTSGEESKSGFADAGEFAEAAAQIAQFPQLSLKGIMTMAPFVDNEVVVRRCFSLARQWGESIESLVDGPLQLSMGMSSDYPWAVAEGSNLLRVGTTLFGRRD